MQVLERLRAFKGESQLKKAVMNMLVKTADEKSLEGLREEFQKYDTDGTGLIDMNELKTAIK